MNPVDPFFNRLLARAVRNRARRAADALPDRTAALLYVRLARDVEPEELARVLELDVVEVRTELAEASVAVRRALRLPGSDALFPSGLLESFFCRLYRLVPAPTGGLHAAGRQSGVVWVEGCSLAACFAASLLILFLPVVYYLNLLLE